MTAACRRPVWGPGWLVLTVLMAPLAASAQPAPTPAPAAAEEPTVKPIEPPRPEAQAVVQQFEAALGPRPGGLRSDQVAARVQSVNPQVIAKQKEVAAAAARVDEAAVLFLPRLTFTARYVRLSPVDASLGPSGVSLVFTQAPAGTALPVVPDPQTGQLIVPAFSGGELSFASPLNQYSLQGALIVPLSDYVFRLTQNYNAAKYSEDAARLQEVAARRSVELEGRRAYYNWVRARGGLIVAEQGLQTAQAHLQDVRVAVAVGTASRADQLFVESQVAQTQLVVDRTRNLVELSAEQLRVLLNEPHDRNYEIGEDINAPLPNEPLPPLPQLFDEAMRNRPELQALDKAIAATRKGREATQAGYLPRVAAFGDINYANPNTRVFPQSEEWKATWDVGVQLEWVINDTLSTSSKVSQMDAQTAQLQAQKAQAQDGIRMQVTQAYNAVQEARTTLVTTQQQLQASEESYRVRRELFRAGRATSAELTDAENALMQARYNALNARIDARIARAELLHALGRNGQARP